MAHYQSKRIDHLGLVAGFCHDLGLIEIVDNTLNSGKERKVKFGQLFFSMILNGLGFTGRTLHMYSEYFKDKAIQRLIAPDLQADSLNDDALGRCLDELFKYGVSELYQEIAARTVQ